MTIINSNITSLIKEYEKIDREDLIAYATTILTDIRDEKRTEEVLEDVIAMLIVANGDY